MFKFIYTFLTIILCLTATAQNPVNITLSTQPFNLAVPAYTRATNSINLLPGFKYGEYSGATNLLNLSIGNNPSFVNSYYIGSGINPGPLNCNPGEPDQSKPIGEIAGSYAISPTGAAMYDIPIFISPGTAGMAPELNISYNSQAGLGILGRGWILNGLSKITRTGKTPIQDTKFDGVALNNTDVFALNNNRLFVLTGNYGDNGSTYYTEMETFSAITANGAQGNGPQSFSVRDKNNNVFEFGNTLDSRLTGVGDNTVMSWFLNKVTDEFGNYILYFYKSLNGEIVVDKIEYTGNAAANLNPYNRVEFEYIPTADKNTFFIGGREFNYTKILRSISVYAENNLVKKYVFDYAWNKQSQLSKITEIDANGNELMPTTFCWNEPGPVFFNEGQLTINGGSPFGLVYKLRADLDGNGTQDRVDFYHSFTYSSFRILTNNGPVNPPNPNISPYSTLVLDTVNPKERIVAGYVTDENFDNKQEVYIITTPTTDVSNWYVLNKIVYDPAIQGNYSLTKTNFSTLQTYSFIVPPESTQPPSVFYAIQDFTGDGENDKLLIDPEKIVMEGSNCNFSFYYNSYGQFARPFQFDSDGELEYVIYDYSSLNSLIIKILDLNINTSSFSQIYTYTLDDMVLQAGVTNSQKFRNNLAIGDFNNDGKSDIFLVTEDLVDMGVLYSTGQSFKPFKSLSKGFLPVPTFGAALGPTLLDIAVVDLNKDGIDDVNIDCFYETQSNISNGPENVEGYDYNHNRHTRYKETPRRTGEDSHCLTRTYFFHGDNFTEGGNIVQSSFQQPGGGYYIQGSADYEGDGIVDLTNPWSEKQIEQAFINLAGETSNVITQISTGLGNIISLKYSNIVETRSAFYSESGSILWGHRVYHNTSTTNYSGTDLFNYKPSIFCLTEMQATNAQATYRANAKYTYNDAIIHTKGRGFLGFEHQNTYEVPDEISPINSGNYPVYSWRCSSTTNSFNNPNKIPLQIEYITGKYNSSGGNNDFLHGLGQSGIMYSKLSKAYSIVPRYTKGFFISTSQSNHRNYLNSKETTTQYTYDNNGNPTLIAVLEGWGGSTLVSQTQNVTYVLNNGNYKPESILTIKTQQSESPYSRSANFFYDQQGHLTSVLSDPTFGSNSLNKVFSNFTPFGQAQAESISAGDLPAPRSATILFDPKGRFVTKITNALGYFEEYAYESRFGNVIQHKDISGLITTFSYDFLGRLTQALLPDGTTNKMSYSFENISNFPYPSTGSSIGVFSILSESQGQPYIKTYYDSYGKVLRNETQGFDGTIIYQDNKYNYFFNNSLLPSGLLLENTQPHFAGQSTYIYQKHEYENLAYRLFKQKVMVQNPLAPVPNLFVQYSYNTPSQNTNYNKRTITVSDHLGNQLVKEFNSAGQNDVVRNIRGTTNQTANYVFHSCGKVRQLSLSTPPNTQINIGYNNLGQRIQLTDPSAGTSQYQYNTLGELLQETLPGSPVDYVHNYTYDVLGRLLTKSGNISGLTTYEYVTANNGKGLIKKITGSQTPDNVITELVYDNFSRVTERKEIIGTKNFINRYEYDNLGRLKEYQFPNGFIVKQNFNSLGYLNQIKDNNDNLIWNLNSVNAVGQITGYNYGNGITTQKAFSELNYLQSIDHGAVHKQEYDLNPVTQNMSSRIFTDFTGFPSVLKDKFSYDDADRLTQAQHVDPFNPGVVYQTNDLSYNLIGNITHKDDAGDYLYSNISKPFNLTNIINPTPNIGLNTLNLDYNDLRKPSKISEDITNKEMNIIYGNDENRIKMTYKIGGVNQYERYYLENYDRQETSNGYKEWNYIYAPSGLCVVNYNNNGNQQLLFVQTDHLGSPVILTNQSQQVVEKYAFDAWGRRRHPDTWGYTGVPNPQIMIRGYTMHEHLDEFGLVNMNARIYDPVLGRFLQPDNVIQDPDNLQNLNRYSYALNNPLKYTDPSGNEYDDGYDDDGWDDGYDGGPGPEIIFALLDSYYHEFITSYVAFEMFGEEVIVTAHDDSGSEHLDANMDDWNDYAGQDSELQDNYADAGYEESDSERYYGQTGDGGVWDDVLYVNDQINQFNPIANFWDLTTFAFTGKDRFGNRMSHGAAWLKAASIAPIGKLGALGVNTVKGAAKGGSQGGLNLFKWGAEQTGKSTGWKAGDYMLHLPNKGTPKLNWKANYGALRSEMNLGKPIFDSYRLPNGNLIPTGGFLNAERYILQDRGWIYNPGNGAWMPPIR